jgi:hypothetical protein
MITNQISKEQESRLRAAIEEIENNETEIHLPESVLKMDKSDLLKLISKLL